MPGRRRRQPSVLVFPAQDPEGNAFCYSNADIGKSEEAEEIFRFIDFRKRLKGKNPAHLVFDSKLTNYANLGRLDETGIAFITLRRRSHGLLKEIENLPPTAWRRITLPVPTRKWKTPRYFEQPVKPAERLPEAGTVPRSPMKWEGVPTGPGPWAAS